MCGHGFLELHGNAKPVSLKLRVRPSGYLPLTSGSSPVARTAQRIFCIGACVAAIHSVEQSASPFVNAIEQVLLDSIAPNLKGDPA
jgi:hypothetical protein